MAEISFSVFSKSTTSGESSEMTPLADGQGFFQTGCHPSYPAVKIPGQLADIFDGLFCVLRQRIHLAIHPVNELAGVSQRLFEMPGCWRPGPGCW